MRKPKKIVDIEKETNDCIRILKDLWKNKVLYFFLLPAIVFTLIFNYRPLYGIIMAFQEFDIGKGLRNSEFVGLLHFKDLLSNLDFYKVLRNTFAMSFFGFIIGFPATIAFAVMLNEFNLQSFKKVVQSLTYLPHFISWVIVAGLLYKMLDQDTGIINLVLSKLGVEPIAFFREPKYFWGIYVGASFWKELGWSTILYLSAMTTINPELYEASFVDGAKRFHRIWHITLPGIAPTVVILMILTISGFFSAGGLEPVYALRNPLTADRSDTIAVYTYLKGIRMAEYGYAAAIGLAQSLMSLILLFSTNSYAKRIFNYSLF